MIKVNPERLIKYRNRTTQTKDEAEKVKPAGLGDDLRDHMVQHEEEMTEKFVMKKNKDIALKGPKISTICQNGIRGLRNLRRSGYHNIHGFIY